MSQTYTVKQVADILGYSTNSIYSFLKEKRIKGVRVGRGRFRIPQEELDRLLAKKPISALTQILAIPQTKAVPQTIMAQLPVNTPVPTPSIYIPYDARVEVPSLFDWFVGVSSILLSFSMFLFSSYQEEFNIQRFNIWLIPIKISFLAAGIGLLFTDIIGKRYALWHSVFQGILLLSYSLFSLILWQAMDREGALVFGLLALTLLVNFIFAPKGIASFAFYAALLIFITPAMLVSYPVVLNLPPTIPSLPLTHPLLVGAWITAVAGGSLFLWWSYYHHRFIFRLLLTTIAVFLIILSLGYANSLYWGRSLFLLMTALVGIFLPTWESLHFNHKHDRRVVFNVFGIILFLFLIVIALVRLIQTNLIDYGGKQLGDKVTYGRIVVESTLDSSLSTLKGTAVNPLLVEALTKEDKEVLVGLTRGMFEGNRSFLEILTWNSQGTLLTVYPYNSSREPSYESLTDATRKTLASRKSSVFEILVGESKEKLIFLTVPVIDSQKSQVGVLSGVLDLNFLGDKLQQLATTKMGEYFVVVDKEGQALLQPEGIDIDEVALLLVNARLGGTDKHGVFQSYSASGLPIFLAYETVDQTDWMVAAQAPLGAIVRTTHAATIAIFSTIVLSILITVSLLASHRHKFAPPEIG